MKPKEKKLLLVEDENYYAKSAEVLKLMQGFIDTVRKIREENKTDTTKTLKRVEELVSETLSSLKELQNITARTEREAKKSSDSAVSSFEREANILSTKFEALSDRMDSVRDGKDADNEAIAATILAQIEQKDLISAEAVRDKLESLKGDERLDASAIKGLEEKLEDLKKSLSSGGGRIISQARRYKLQTYSLTSQCNGVLKAFTLPKKTVSVVGVFGTQFPVNFDESDWSFSGNTLTLGTGVSAPDTGQTLWCLIETL